MHQTVLFWAILIVGLFVVFLGPMLLFACFLRLRKDSRSSPLTKDLLRPPGYSLGRKIDDLDLQIDSGLIVLVICIPAIFIVHLCRSYFGGEPEDFSRTLSMIAIGGGMFLLSGQHVWKLMKSQRVMRLGLDGEQFVGEQLNQLMLRGCRVFHDIPFPYGNIDHVVVSHSGVFSVNTKMHGKLKGDDRSADILVDYPRKQLKFPDREIPLPEERLETEAKWLSKHLSSAVGVEIDVEAMLALPGWFVKHQNRQKEAFVFNPFNAERFFVHNRIKFQEQLIKQISHQLDQLCRDIEPIAKETRKRWES